MCTININLIKSGPKITLNYSPCLHKSRSIINFRSSNLNLRRRRHFPDRISSVDDDFGDVSFGFGELDEMPENDPFYMMYSSGDESDTDMVLNPIGDVDLPLNNERNHVDTPEAALTLAAHRFASIQRGHKRKRTNRGVIINLVLVAFLALFLSFVDWCSWKIVRMPLEPFYLTQPFSVSIMMSVCAGCLFVPIADSLKIIRLLRKPDPLRCLLRRKRPTMGGLYFVPIGVSIAVSIARKSSLHVNSAAAVTLAFGAIGLYDDIVNLMDDQRFQMPGWVKLFLQVLVGTGFSSWLYAVDIPTPYKMKFLVPLPPPHGIANVGKFYLALTTFCFVAMGNGLNLTDGLDGFVGGVSALAFIGMSIAVLPISPDLAIFGASMAGACIGFLFHNRYKASIMMGDIGSFALGGALAAMAACTGMFIPLFISAGVFVIEVVSVIVQVLLSKASHRITRHALPLQYHLKLMGIKTPIIVASAYALSSIFALVAGYVGLISA